jgi:transmembrane sensor
LTIATETGEQRFVSLVDGSTLELNSRSRVRIRFSDRERDVDLIEGQALFHVAKDVARPFIVKSGTTLVRAVGTQFDVYRKVSGTTVTVVEGRVAVLSPMLDAQSDLSPSGSAVPRQASPSSPSIHTPRPVDAQSAASVPRPIQRDEQSGAGEAVLPNAPNAIYLVAGEQITVGSQSVPRATHADPTVATAWTQHELVFESTPLNDVAQDFNRYNTRQLVVSDPALREFHITGVFSSTDPASLLRFLRAQRGITVEETDTEIRISK